MSEYHKADFDRLTARQMSVLRGLCEGLSVEETGAQLGIATQTAKNTLHRVYVKLRLASLDGSRAPRACYLLGRADKAEGRP